MRKILNKKNLLLGVFFSLIFIGILPNMVKASDTPVADPIVKANWLYINVADDQYDNMVFSSGGEDLHSFRNLGIVSATEKEVLYKAEATFGFEITAHSSVSVRDAFPQLNPDRIITEPYLYVSDVYIGSVQDRRYDAQWSDVYLGEMNAHDQLKYTPITVGIKPLTSTSGTIYVNGEAFSVPTYTFDVIQSNVNFLEKREIGVYDNTFVDVLQNQELEVSFTDLDDTSNENQMVINYLNSHDIGIDATADPVGTRLSQKVLDASQEGSTFHNPNPAENELYTFNLYSRIAPEITKYTQPVKKTQVSLGVLHGLITELKVTYGPSTTYIPRCVGVYIQNYYLHWKLTVDVELYATIPSTAELTETILHEPALELGNWVWSTSIMSGDVNITLQTKDSLDIIWQVVNEFLWIIITIVLVAVGLYIFVRVGVPMIVRKTKKRR